MPGGLFPTYLSSGAYDIDYDKLYDMGYRGIIFDIDYTLVPYNAMAEERTRELFKKLREKGFRCAFLSNNHEDRVRGFNKDIGIEYMVDAYKPLKKGFVRIIDVLGTEKKRTIAIGDQIFTDVWGANNAGIDNICVGRVVPPGELQLKLKAVFEKPVLCLFKKSKKYKEI